MIVLVLKLYKHLPEDMSDPYKTIFSLLHRPRDVSKVIIFNIQGKLILQDRDVNSTIQEPGKISLFGGGVEAGEDYITGAIRELKEEIGVDVRESELHYAFSKKIKGRNTMNVHYFLLSTPLDMDELTIYEGRGILIDPQQLVFYPLTPLLGSVVYEILNDNFLPIQSTAQK